MSGELGSTDFEKNGAPSRNRGGSQGPLAITWSAVEFAVDSPLEGDGFEPSGPLAKEPASPAEGSAGEVRIVHRRVTGEPAGGSLAPDHISGLVLGIPVQRLRPS